MNPNAIVIIEALMFFVVLGVTFKALMSFDITKHFHKNAIWQMQITVIFASIALSYLVTKALMTLIQISLNLFT